MHSRDPTCVPRASVEQGGRLTSRQAAPIRPAPPASPTVGLDPIRLYPTSASSSMASHLSKDPRLGAIPGRTRSKTEVARVTASASHRAQWAATQEPSVDPGRPRGGALLMGGGGAVSARLSRCIADAKVVDCSHVRNNFRRVATRLDLGTFVFHRPLPRAVSAAATSIWCIRGPSSVPIPGHSSQWGTSSTEGAADCPSAHPVSGGAARTANPDVHHPI